VRNGEIASDEMRRREATSDKMGNKKVVSNEAKSNKQ